jgi:cytochrome oxidase Cu insertion factor (SCO1/SenC/PrrC family)
VTSEYSRPVALGRTRWAIWGLAAVGLLAGCGGSSHSAAGPVISGPDTTWASGAKRAPAFLLKDQNGKAVSLASLHGRPVVVTFIDPLCRSYCPIEAARLGDVVRSLPPAARPAIVGVSVNVYGDARRYLMQDIAKWKVGSAWHWGVGTPAQLASVWKHYDIGVLDQPKKVDGIEIHNIVHTEAAYVVDGNGYERALYLWPFTAADMRTTLAGLTG